MEKIKQIVTQIEAWLQTFTEQNKKSDFRGCRESLRVLDRLYENLEAEIKNDLRLEAKSQYYKPMSQL